MVVKISKQRAQKKCIIKRKLKFENYKACLKATQLENKVNYLEKKELYKRIESIDSIEYVFICLWNDQSSSKLKRRDEM